MISDSSLSEPTRILIFISGSIIVLAGMKAAAPIVAPIVFSIFLSAIFGMLLYWLEKKGFSRRLALIATLARKAAQGRLENTCPAKEMRTIDTKPPCRAFL